MRGRAAHGSDTADSWRARVARRSVLVFAAWSLLTVTVVTALAFVGSSSLVRQAALAAAEAMTQGVSSAIVAPLATDGLRAGDPATHSQLASAMAARLQDGSIHDVRVWTDAGDGLGRVAWSDDESLVGRTFHMRPESYALFTTPGVVSRVSPLDREENLQQRRHGELVEVYSSFVDASGGLSVFEAYLPADAATVETGTVANRVLPLVSMSLLVLALTLLPPWLWLSGRAQSNEEEMSALLRLAADSSDLERRRIAQDLHDGVLQTLAGAGYRLASLSRQVDDRRLVRSLDQVSTGLRRDVTSLRALLLDVYPPDLDEIGLAAALQGVLLQEPLAGVKVRLDVPPDLALGPVTTRLAYRVVRESLRNVARHARASTVDVRLSLSTETLVVQVRDDGIGFAVEADQEGLDPGIGQRVLRDLVRDAGGSLDLVSAAGVGTLVTASLPLGADSPAATRRRHRQSDEVQEATRRAGRGPGRPRFFVSRRRSRR